MVVKQEITRGRKYNNRKHEKKQNPTVDREQEKDEIANENYHIDI